MANYTYTLPIASTKDHVRLILGDTGALKDENSASVWILSDEEITEIVSNYPVWGAMIAQAADAARAQLAMLPDKYKAGSGDIEAEWASRDEMLAQLAFRARHGYVPAPTPGP